MNPMGIIQMMISKNPNMQNNPIVGNTMQMVQNNDVNGLRQLAENICKSKGISLEDAQKQVSNRFGMK